MYKKKEDIGVQAVDVDAIFANTRVSILPLLPASL